ncbi:hypothetical protein BN2537_16021 [Streptomyces venezuelae]|nr:hypothetical protein BN2537_16021 [Streptomyces venezuelae]
MGTVGDGGAVQAGNLGAGGGRDRSGEGGGAENRTCSREKAAAAYAVDSLGGQGVFTHVIFLTRE